MNYKYSFFRYIFYISFIINAFGDMQEDLKRYIMSIKGIQSYQILQLSLKHLHTSNPVIRFQAFGDNYDIKLAEDKSVISNISIYISGLKMTKSQMDSVRVFKGIVYRNFTAISQNVFMTLIDSDFNGFYDTTDITYHLESIKLQNNGTYITILYWSHNEKFRTTSSFSLYDANNLLPFDYKYETFKKREKRKTEIKNKTNLFTYSCSIIVYADHRYYEKIGKFDVRKALTSIVTTFKIADNIFRSHDFNLDGVGDNYGFDIKEIHITKKSNDPNYVFKERYQRAEDYLMKFRDLNTTGYCLGVALTSQKFNNKVIGLSWFGAYTGVCASWHNQVILTHKIGYSLMETGRLLAHEIGHACGSNHDEDNKNQPCYLKDTRKNQGDYIMSQYILKEDLPNTYKFSLCSKIQILRRLRKRSNCFVMGIITATCGNLKIEPSEECDCGQKDLCDSFDKCCTPSDWPDESSRCKHRKHLGMACSPMSSSCCNSDCQIDNTSRVCLEETECVYESRCNGINLTCPEPVNKPTGTTCSRGLFCRNGLCQMSVCDKNNFSDCPCPDNDLCVRCCKKGEKCIKSSLLFQSSRIESNYLAYGSECNDGTGRCEKGNICKYRIYDVTSGLFAEETGKNFRLTVNSWMRNYFYYIIIFILSTVLAFRFVYAVTFHKIDKVIYAKKIGKSVNLSRNIDLQLLRIKYKLKLLHRPNLPNQMTQLSEDKAFIRLRTLFPKARLSAIYKAIQLSSSEAVAVKILLSQGYGMMKLFDRDK